jgi:hypothetical protein
MSFPVKQPTDFPKAYGSHPPLSTTINTYRWRLVVAALFTVMLSTVLVAILSLSGVADPKAGWVLLAPPELVSSTLDEANDLQIMRINTLPAPPLLIEVSTPPDELTAWGVWLQPDTEPSITFMIDPQQRSKSTAATDDWQPFIHIAANSNILLLRVDADGAITWRINGEIAWSGQLLKPLNAAGIRIPASASPSDFNVQLYSLANP